MNGKLVAAILSAVIISATLGGCTKQNNETEDNSGEIFVQNSAAEENRENETLETPEAPEEQAPAEVPEVVLPEPQPKPKQPEPEEPEEEQPPKVQTVDYLKVTSESVNIRSGAGTSYSVLGTAEKNTLYALLGEENGFYRTGYKNRTAYISKKYCTVVEMDRSDSALIEEVILEGAKLLGTPYVYGATRLHDGRGNMLKGFTVNAFDCSSLMQYIFYRGANKILEVNTRTQIYQGTTVLKSQLKRGDLIFFTNAERKDKKGIERVGHVALYLGDNYILHTASDYAKIEQMSSLRWSYYIQAQRMI